MRQLEAFTGIRSIIPTDFTFGGPKVLLRVVSGSDEGKGGSGQGKRGKTLTVHKMKRRGALRFRFLAFELLSC